MSKKWPALKLLSLVFWFVAHAAAVWIIHCSNWPNILPWTTIAYAFLTWAFIFWVHWIDRRNGEGIGVYAVAHRRRADEGPANGEQSSELTKLVNGLTEHLGMHHSQSLRTELITITTGFTSVLAFESVHAYAQERSPWTFPGLFLLFISVLFVLACVVNLIQMHLHILLSRSYWTEKDRNSFRGLIRKLEKWGWNLFLTPVILFLCLFPDSKNNLGYWLAFGVNFIYGALLWMYYFSLEPDAKAP